MAHLHSVCVCVVIHGFEHIQLFGVLAHPRIYLYKRDAETHYDALIPQFEGALPAGDFSDSITLDSRAAARQHSLVYQLKAAAAPNNSRRLLRRLQGFDSRAPIVVSDSEDVECALPSDLQIYSRFIDHLHSTCGPGIPKAAVQRVLRLQLQCTFASWVQLSPTQKDALYVQALQILRTLSEYLKDCVVDLEQLAAEYRDAGNAAAAEEMLQQLTSVLHPQYSSEDELEEVKCE